MAMYSVKSESLTAVADAIRAKTGGTDLLAFPDGMVEAIGGISGGGGGFGLEMGGKSGGGSRLPELNASTAYCDLAGMGLIASFVSND
jgi:hypothetical protein